MRALHIRALTILATGSLLLTAGCGKTNRRMPPNSNMYNPYLNNAYPNQYPNQYPNYGNRGLPQQPSYGSYGPGPYGRRDDRMTGYQAFDRERFMRQGGVVRVGPCPGREPWNCGQTQQPPTGGAGTTQPGQGGGGTGGTTPPAAPENPDQVKVTATRQAEIWEQVCSTASPAVPIVGTTNADEDGINKECDDYLFTSAGYREAGDNKSNGWLVSVQLISMSGLRDVVTARSAELGAEHAQLKKDITNLLSDANKKIAKGEENGSSGSGGIGGALLRGLKMGLGLSYGEKRKLVNELIAARLAIATKLGNDDSVLMDFIKQGINKSVKLDEPMSKISDNGLNRLAEGDDRTLTTIYGGESADQALIMDPLRRERQFRIADLNGAVTDISGLSESKAFVWTAEANISVPKSAEITIADLINIPSRPAGVIIVKVGANIKVIGIDKGDVQSRGQITTFVNNIRNTSTGSLSAGKTQHIVVQVIGHEANQGESELPIGQNLVFTMGDFRGSMPQPVATLEGLTQDNSTIAKGLSSTANVLGSN
jgi:hypothetical protein